MTVNSRRPMFVFIYLIQFSTITNCQNYFWEDVVAILTNDLPDKTYTPYLEPNDIKYILFTRELRDGIELNVDNLHQINSTKSIKYLVHGFVGRMQWYKPMTEAYLRKGDYQVIHVDWSRGSYLFYGYLSAMANTKVVGRSIAIQIYNLNEFYKVDLRNVHILGLSLGSHIAGIAGKELIRLTNGNKLGRITAFDPAGVLYEIPKMVSENKLNMSDALFTDITHTDCNFFGYKSEIGHIDFYPNGCNEMQPGCLTFVTNFKLNEIFDDIVAFIACSHERSTAYFEEAVERNAYLIENCINDFKDCQPANDIIYGEDTDWSSSGKYYFRANSKSPFGTL